MSLEPPPTESEQFQAAEAAGHAAASSNDGERHISIRKKTSTCDSALQYLLIKPLRNHDHCCKNDEDRRLLPDYNFLTVQMSAKKALHQFGQKRGRRNDERAPAAHRSEGDAPM